jgi:hypothetical protein
MESTDRNLWIVRKHEVVEVCVGSPIDRIVHGTSALRIVEQLSDLAPEFSLRLSRGAGVHFEHETTNVRPLILASLEPDAHLQDELYERYEADRTACSFSEVGPIDTGNDIDGSRWGWIPTDDDQVHFALVPGKGNKQGLASLRAWMSESVTGTVICWGMCLFETVATIWHEADESEPGTSYIRPIYNTLAHGDLLLNVVEDWNADYGAMCPVCNQDERCDMYGWDVDLLADPNVFSESDVGAALGQVWHPCIKHRRRRLIQLRNAGRNWIWANRRWEADGERAATN